MGLTFSLKALYSNISLHTIEGTFKLDDVDHRVPDNLHGTVLRPLNDWKELELELYAAKAAKYIGERIQHGRTQRTARLPLKRRSLPPASTSGEDRGRARQIGTCPERPSILPNSVNDAFPEDIILWLWESSRPLYKEPNSFVSYTSEESAKHRELRRRNS